MSPCAHIEKFLWGRPSQLSNGGSNILIPLALQKDGPGFTQLLPWGLFPLAKSRLSVHPSELVHILAF